MSWRVYLYLKLYRVRKLNPQWPEEKIQVFATLYRIESAEYSLQQVHYFAKLTRERELGMDVGSIYT